jgi:putative ABC transport system permease protein
LLGLLEGVNAGFARAIATAHREFLYTTTRVRGGAPMPISALTTLRNLHGVAEVAPRAYFVGSYRDPGLKNAITAIATEPDLFFRLLRGIRIEPAAINALKATRNGMLVTPALMAQFGWKVGDTLSLQSKSIKSDGSPDWTFHLVGTFDFPLAPSPSYFGVINYAYFNEYRSVDRDTAEVFYVRIADPDKAIAMAATIDKLFANSSHETRTRSQQQRAETQTKQLGDVKFFTTAVIGAVLFTLAFLTGNSLRQALQERTQEFGILKSVGYSDRSVFSLALAEALLLYLPPAALGLLLARLAAPLAQQDLGAIVVSASVAIAGLVCAACLALLGSALPAVRLARMPISTALRKG